MSHDNITSSVAALLKKAQAEHAAAIVPMDLDLQELTTEEKVTYANIARMQRIIDADFESVVNDHTVGITNVVSADKAVDLYDQDYLLELKLSYQAISNLCSVLIAAVDKYKITPPKVWLDFANGEFPYELELESE